MERSNREIAQQLNFFTSYLGNVDQDNIAEFVSTYLCADNNNVGDGK